jgi:hypothetical protein
MKTITFELRHSGGSAALKWSKYGTEREREALPMNMVDQTEQSEKTPMIGVLTRHQYP